MAPFVKAFIVDGGNSGAKLLYGNAINPATEVSNNPTIPTILNTVTIDKAIHLLVNGDTISYDFVYGGICTSETEHITMEVVLHDGITEHVLFTNTLSGNIPNTWIPIAIQRTDVGDLLVSASNNWLTPNYINMPTPPTFTIYMKVTATDVSAVTNVKIYSVICESKTQ